MYYLYHVIFELGLQYVTHVLLSICLICQIRSGHSYLLLFHQCLYLCVFGANSSVTHSHCTLYYCLQINWNIICDYISATCISTMSQRSSSSPVLPPSSQFSGNRNIVVVDQEIFNDSISSLENLDESFTISESSSGTRQLHGASQVTESSVSFQDKSSENCTYLCNCLDELQIPSHLEDLVDRLGSEIEQASIGYERILGDLKEIPSLKEKIGSLTKENKILEQEVEKKAAMIESLNERMSLLQEQNVQLAQLSRTSGDQSATLSMRNSLVASLTQLKKLQAQVDEIPELKNKISNLTEDVKRKETTELHSTTSSEALEVYPKKLKEQISHLSQLIENLSTRMEEYEKSHSLENVALASFKKLEELLAKLLESKSIMPFDSSNKAEVVDNNCISLLSKEMLRREVEFSKQKDLIISKLFDIQYSGLQVAKSEVMQSLSGTSSMENEFVKSQSFKKKTDGAVSAVNILPLFQSQLSKLHHIRLIYRHSKNTWAAIMPCCKESAGVGSNNEKYLVQELKHLAAISEENIRKTQPNILEGSTSINPILQCDETCSAMEEELTKERRMHKSYFKKYKKEKEKRKSFEEKHREVCAKYQAIATELTQSAALLQKYQFQCEELEVERNKIQSDHHKLMEDYGNLQAQHSDFFFKSVNYISIPNYFSNITGTMSSVKAAELENSLIERLCLSVHTLEESVPSKFKQSGLGNIITKIDSAMKELVSTHEVVLEKLKNEVSEHQRSTLKKEVVQLASEKCSLEQELACLNSKHQDIILDLQNQLESFQTGLKMCQAEKDTLQMKLKEVAALVNEVNGNLEARKVVCAELEKENDNLRQKLHEKERQIVPNSSLFEKEHQYGGRIEMDTLDASLRESLELKITILESELENYRKSSIHKSQSTQTPHVSVMLNVLSKSTQTDLLHSDEKGMSVMGISKSTQTDLLYGDDKGMSVMRISKSTQTDMLHSNEKGLSVMRISTSTQTDSLQSDEKGKHSVPLNEYNLQLENQVSVLSQWNDKQRAEIEELERQVQDMYKEYDRLLIDFKNQEDLAQQNANLQQELLEVEDEMKMLRKVSNLEIQEELQMKLDAQIFVVTTLNEKNKDLHKQVGPTFS